MASTLPFDSAFLHKLELLSLVSRRALPGAGAGLRRSVAAGASVEFADFRTYAPGDDFRRVDWNAYARLGKLFLRVYVAEENATATLFLDCSGSMAGGTPSKGDFARRAWPRRWPTWRWRATIASPSAALRQGFESYLPPQSPGAPRPGASGASWTSSLSRAAPTWAAPSPAMRRTRAAPASPSSSPTC